jgi:hypothetical protein
MKYQYALWGTFGAFIVSSVACQLAYEKGYEDAELKESDEYTYKNIEKFLEDKNIKNLTNASATLLASIASGIIGAKLTNSYPLAFVATVATVGEAGVIYKFYEAGANQAFEDRNPTPQISDPAVFFRNIGNERK